MPAFAVRRCIPTSIFSISRRFMTAPTRAHENLDSGPGFCGRDVFPLMVNFAHFGHFAAMQNRMSALTCKHFYLL